MRDRIDIQPLTPALEPAWTAFVAAHPHASFFHEMPYRQAVQRAYGHRPIYLVALRNSELCGILPQFRIDSRLTGTTLVSQPYATYGGPLANDCETVSALRNAAEQAAQSSNARLIDWRCAHSLATGHWPLATNYVTFRRELPADPAALPAWLPRKARAAARRAAERHELTVEWEDANLPAVWALYARSMRRLASINYTRTFFEALVTQTPGDHLVQLVRCCGRPVAGLLTFLHRGTAMPYFVGVDERVEIYGLTNFLYFKAMERAVELGCHTFDFGRSRIDNAGSFDFKRFHGFEPTPLAYERFVPAGRRDPQLTPANPRFALARRIWPRLPLSLTRPLGGWLSRSIPG